MTPALTRLSGIALGTGIACTGVGVEFAYAVQRRILIQAIVVTPTDSMLAPVEVMIVTHAPERAKVQRFEDGSTISDQGISRITYAMEPSPENPSMHRTPIPTEEDLLRNDRAGERWFAHHGVGYLRAEVGERVVLYVHNGGDRDVEASALILCLQDDKESHDSPR